MTHYKLTLESAEQKHNTFKSSILGIGWTKLVYYSTSFE